MSRVSDIEPSPGSFGDVLNKQKAIEKEREMAKSNNGSGADQETAEAGHNSVVIDDAIRIGFDALYELDKTIADLTEEHLSGPKKQRTKAWRNIKKNTDIERRFLDIKYKEYRIVREAMEDADDQTTIDKMKAIHDALHPGQSVDWVQAVESTLPDQQSLT